jgi:hypothetical protein
MQTYMNQYTAVWNNAFDALPSVSVNPPAPLLGPSQDWWLQHVVAANPNLPQQAELTFVEHIHSYYLELGRVFDTLDQIVRRFAPDARHPPAPQLNRFDVSPLQPLARLLWGYKEDKEHRTTQEQRRMEYLRQYGLDLYPQTTTTSAFESRSRFLQYFHTVLNACARYFRQNSDNTIVPDPFPVLSTLRPLHMLLAESAHNQYQFMTDKARVELIVVQHILSQNEVQRFLGAPVNVPYPAPWMGAVDSMRRIMRWGDTSVTEFFNLAVMGEVILLTVRFGPFNPAFTNAGVAGAWAIALQEYIQQYVYSYQAVTGIDLGADTKFVGGRIDTTPPQVYLSARQENTRLRLKAV